MNMPNTLPIDTNLYNILNWGGGYFNINAQGNIDVRKNAEDPGVELHNIVKAANRAGLQLPLLLRFPDILHHRVARIHTAFAEAILENQYHGSYKLVYPIKVNQELCVVKELLKTPEHRVGLEAGSKPELMAVLGLLGGNASTIICNGYKDSRYIRTALIAQQMGHEVFIVIEKYSELAIIVKESARLNIKPRLGVRVRLVTKSAGKWENTGGAKSKFGLNAEQILDLIRELKAHDLLDCLQLMHCHLGSQIGNIQDIRRCMQEVARYYVELRRLDAPITTVDVGGGLGVDYAGTLSATDCSMNYSIKEYATNILLALKPLCEEANMPEPNLISESGRALTAHHAILITNITDVERVEHAPAPKTPSAQDSHIVRDIWDTYSTASKSMSVETYNYAKLALDEAHSMFKHGVMSLEEKSKVEQIFRAICLYIVHQLDERIPNEQEILQSINERMAAKIFCNLSFFQSIPDAWAIGQIFPVAPISHLTQNPAMQSILYDLTCDSDGTIKKYTSANARITDTLMLPDYDPKNPYMIAFFLVGAYQEILGNLHNLFGDTNSLDVILDGQGQFAIKDLVTGDTVGAVLNSAHFDTQKLLLSYEEQLIQTELPDDIIESYLNELRSVFTQLTYLGNSK
jgi:arginine decarboxylase